MEGNSTFIAYPFTSGTIIGGNFHIRDNATVIFIDSNIEIVGSLDSTSSVPVQFVDGSTISIDGPVELGGNSLIHVSGGTLLNVTNGSISLYQNAGVLSESSSVHVQNGSIRYRLMD